MPAWSNYKSYMNTNTQVAYVICYEALNFLLYPKSLAILAALESHTIMEVNMSY